MELVISDGTQVHITIGTPALLALPSPRMPSARSRLRPVVTGMAVAVLVLGSYQIGRQTGGSAPDRTIQADARGPAIVPHALAEPRLAATGQQRPLLPAQPSLDEPGRIPAEFAQQLRQAPTVIPPPGQAGPAAPASNPFGLHP